MAQLESSTLKAHIAARTDLQYEPKVNVDYVTLVIKHDVAIVAVLGLQHMRYKTHAGGKHCTSHLCGGWCSSRLAVAAAVSDSRCSPCTCMRSAEPKQYHSMVLCTKQTSPAEGSWLQHTLLR